MNLNEGQRVVLATIAGAAALLASTGLASASPSNVRGHAARTTPAAHHSTAKKKAPRPKPGLFVSGETKVTTAVRASAYLLDPVDHEHFVTLVPNATHPGKDSVEYYTRALGAKHWTVHAAPTLINSAGSPRLEEDVEWNTDGVDVVVYACDGTYAATASATASRLPEFTLVQSANTCSSGATASSAYRHLSTVFNDENTGVRLGVLVPDSTVSHTWDLLEGNPGGTFTNLLSLPTTNSFVPTQLAASANYSGDLSVVGYGVDGSGDKGVFATRLTWTYNSTLQQQVPSWTNLKEIATLGDTDSDYVIDSLAEYNGTTDVGLYKAPGTTPGQKHTLFIDEGDTSNQWSAPIALAHATINDRDLLVARNPRTGTLHATWERTITTSKSAKTVKSGIMQQRLHADWTKALFLTHWYRDTPLQASLDTHGNIHVEYRQS
jgi:hypothetical protein